MRIGPLSPQLAAIAAVVGPAHVSCDADVLAKAGADVFFERAPPLAVVSPGSTEELRHVVLAACAAGLTLATRGGGLTYSAGYLTDRTDTVLIDTARLNAITIDAEDMWVRAGAGVTWAALNDALAAKGLRTPFWGTGSGRFATVAGTLSTDGANYGSGRYGTVADSVLSVTVVRADGSVLTTGTAAGRDTPPFLRNYGPDLTGLFVGDCGALGIKAAVVLQLIPRPAGVAYAAFSFEDANGFCDAMSALGRAGRHAECYGFDPAYMSRRTTHASVTQDLKHLAQVATGQGSVLKGLTQAFKVAAAGRRFLADAGYTLHVVIDGADQAEAEQGGAAVQEMCLATGGRAIAPSIPAVVRANPFPPPTLMFGPEGERWIPVHGIVPHSRGKAVVAAIDAYMDAQSALIAEHGITWCFVALPVGRGGLLIEPTLYWRDAPTAMQDRYLSPAEMAAARTHAPNPAARAAVAKLREGIAALFAQHGSAHFQAGRLYPFLETRTPEARRLLQELKRLVDPDRRLNPGALGL